jgi:hypothetical protein
MKYSDDLQCVYDTVFNLEFISVADVIDLKKLIEALIDIMELKSDVNEDLTKSKSIQKRQFEIDLGIVNRSLKRENAVEMRDLFYSAKIGLEQDLKNAISIFRFKGF